MGRERAGFCPRFDGAAEGSIAGRRRRSARGPPSPAPGLSGAGAPPYAPRRRVLGARSAGPAHSARRTTRRCARGARKARVTRRAWRSPSLPATGAARRAGLAGAEAADPEPRGPSGSGRYDERFKPRDRVETPGPPHLVEGHF